MKQTKYVRTCDICNEKIEEKYKGYHFKGTFYRIKKCYVSSSFPIFEKKGTIDICESCMNQVRALRNKVLAEKEQRRIDNEEAAEALAKEGECAEGSVK